MSSLDDCKNRLKKLFDINSPIIFIQSDDIEFVDQLISESPPVRGNAERIFEWNSGTTCTYFETCCSAIPEDFTGEMGFSGRVGVPLESFLRVFLKNTESLRIVWKRGGIILLKNIHDKIDLPEIKTSLQLIARRRLWESDFNLTVVIVDTEKKFPSEIEHYVDLVEIPFPEDDEIQEIIKAHEKANGVKNSGGNADLLATLRGLSRFEIHRAVDMAIGSSGLLKGEENEKFLLEQKKQIVKKSSLLEYIDTPTRLSDIGGLRHLKEYLQGEAKIFKHLEEAKENGIPAPKGIFILGMPGCGKSMTAKAVAGTFGVPLLKMDMGGLLGSLLGQSESNMRVALRTAEAIAPCVLWIDEIEKAFAGISGGIGGSTDVMRRLFGYFIGWMQDKAKPVYVIATANKVEDLPPELKRKGRFDEIFCTLLPTEKERSEIFNAHIKKKQNEIAKNGGNMKIECTSDDDFLAFAQACGNDRFNGADIESVVNAALKKCFVALPKRNVLTKEDIVNAINETHPIGDTCKTQIEDMKKLFKENVFIDAGSGEPTGEMNKKIPSSKREFEELYKRALLKDDYGKALQIRGLMRDPITPTSEKIPTKVDLEKLYEHAILEGDYSKALQIRGIIKEPVREFGKKKPTKTEFEELYEQAILDEDYGKALQIRGIIKELVDNHDLPGIDKLRELYDEALKERDYGKALQIRSLIKEPLNNKRVFPPSLGELKHLYDQALREEDYGKALQIRGVIDRTKSRNRDTQPTKTELEKLYKEALVDEDFARASQVRGIIDRIKSRNWDSQPTKTDLEKLYKEALIEEDFARAVQIRGIMDRMRKH